MRTILSKLSPEGTAESYPGHHPGLAAPNREWRISELEAPQGLHPGQFSARAFQINEQIWFGVQVVDGLYAIGGLRGNRVGLG